MNKVIKAESWQIFAVLIFPILLTLAFESILISYAEYISSFFISISFIWIIIVGYKLNDELPKPLRKSNILLLSCGVFLVVSTLIGSFIETDSSNIEDNYSIFIFIITCCYISSIFFVIYYAAIALRKLEKKRKVSLDECLKEYFLFFIPIIGVWFLQPRIKNVYFNKGYKEHGVI